MIPHLNETSHTTVEVRDNSNPKALAVPLSSSFLKLSSL